MIDRSKIYRTAVGVGYDWQDPGCYDEFKKKFHDWIHSTKQPLSGLPESSVLTVGITDAFNQTYSIYNKIGIFPGEYGYHEMVLKDRITTDLSIADVIIVSHPFSSNGMSAHDKLKYADTYNKPIFVDCAFFGICHNTSFDFTEYNNIHSVAFSLSKAFGTGRQRVGLLYTKDRYPVHVNEEWGYAFDLSANYHMSMIDNTTPDTIPEKYKNRQHEICREIEVQPSDTIIFGLDYTDRFTEYKRHNVNRLCLTDLL